MGKIIQSSVGKRGNNQFPDAVVIQLLLNNHIAFDSRLSKWLKPLVANGKVQSADPMDPTITAIVIFQREVLRFPRPTGVINPGDDTVKALSGPILSPIAVPPKPKTDPGEASSGGVKIVLTPAQLASVLVGGNIAPDETLTNRLWGGAKIIGGALEL